MAEIRRALILATAERIVGIALNLLSIVVVARLIAPGEFGVVVLGLSVLGFGEILRDFGGSAYIIREEQLTLAGIRTAFTLTLAFTLLLAAITVALSGIAARFFASPGLASFLHVAALSFLLGPFVSPLFSLLRREMRFGALAAINIATATVNAVVVIALALAGASYMSFAWAGLASGAVGLALGLYARPDLSIYRPTLSEWRSAGDFARYETGATILNRIREDYPLFVAGRLVGADAAGLFHRATTVATLPDRFLLAGLGPVALPALSSAVRKGRALGGAYLKAVELVTAVSWPALALVSLLAHPLVLVLLGSRWLEAVPLVGIMAGVIALNFSAALARPVLVAGGAVRMTWLASLAVVAVALVVTSLTGPHGLTAIARGLYVVAAADLAISLWLVRRETGYSWWDLAAALAPSAAVTVATLLPAQAVLWIAGGTDAYPVAVGFAAGLAGAWGWWKGLTLVGHPLGAEILAAVAAILRNESVARALRAGRNGASRGRESAAVALREVRRLVEGPKPRAAAAWMRGSLGSARRAYLLRRG